MVNRSVVPSLVTGLRVLAVPPLWGFALAGRGDVVGAGLAFAWLTDALDGYLARRLDARTAAGSRLDSAADTLVFVSGVAWLAMLRPDFLRMHAAPIGIWLAIGAAAYLVGWLRFRRLADVHLYSAKAANFLGFLFVAQLLAFDALPTAAFHVVIGILILAAAETLAVVATFDHVDEHVVTIFGRARSGSPASENGIH
jgi:cardiolipin synthase (CMP-forming)